jgi:alanine racemase
MLKSTWLEINLGQLRKNSQLLQTHFGSERKMMAEEGIDSFAVVQLEEAIKLRQAGIGQPILVLSPFHPDMVDLAIQYRVTCTVESMEFLEKWKQAKRPSYDDLQVQIQLNTGMNRHGVSVAQIPEILQFIKTSPGIVLSGIYSNSSSAVTSLTEYAVFLSAIENIPTEERNKLQLHFGNSTTVLASPETIQSTVRFGILHYGLYPHDDVPKTLGIQPAITWKAVINSIHTVEAGEVVGYLASHRTERKSRIAVVSCGYRHGYQRGFIDGSGEILLKGRRVKLLAPPNMNDLMIDVTDIPCQINDQVVLLGKQGNEDITIMELATRINTIEAEVLCLMNNVESRIYLQ